MSSEQSQDRLSLDLVPPQALRRRALAVGIAVVVLAAAIGGLVGLAAGRTGGLVAAAIVGLPLLYLAFTESRRTTWLREGLVYARGTRTRSVDLRKLEQIELLIADVRGKRIVMFVISGGPKGNRVNLAVANYTINAGVELDIVALRKLADALAGGETAHGLVFAELLVGATARHRPGHPDGRQAALPARLAGGLRSPGPAHAPGRDHPVRRHLGLTTAKKTGPTGAEPVSPLSAQFRSVTWSAGGAVTFTGLPKSDSFIVMVAVIGAAAAVVALLGALPAARGTPPEPQAATAMPAAATTVAHGPRG